MEGSSVLIEQTQRFIDENPVSLIMSRVTKNSDGAGGSTSTSSDLPPQVVRLVAVAPSASTERRTSTGEVMATEYSMIAMPTTDVREGDSFMFMGVRYEIAVLLPIGGYELRGEVVRRG